MKRFIGIRSFVTAAGICLAVPILSGCALLGLRGQNREIDASGTVGVQVSGFPATAPVYALLVDETGRILGAEKVPASGLATFILPQTAKPSLAAFADLNGNRRFDAGEPGGGLASVSPVPLSAPAVRTKLPTITPRTSSWMLPVGTVVPAADGAAVNISVGEVTTVTDPRFSAKMGEEGLWRPMATLEAGALGLYFTEPYDPARTPVVFVHGIGGSPRDFAKLIPALNRKRFQAWFFAYPSGFRLAKASGALATMLNIAMKREGVERIHVVAHSMGGLVARDAILKLSALRGGSPVRNFFTISTPWGGDAAARQGVSALKFPVPSWIDMVPGSAFLTNLWKQPLPAGTRHDLIYGYASERRPWLSPDNDGIINEKSAAHLPALKESRRILTLPYAHVEILSKPETFESMNFSLSQP